MLIPAKVFEARRMASKDAMRYQLAGVHFSRVGDVAQAVSTDGKALCRVQWTEADWGDYPADNGTFCPSSNWSDIIPNADCAELAKHKSKLPMLENVALSERRKDDDKTIGERKPLTATTTKEPGQPVSRTVTPIDGAFPDISNLFPTDDPAIECCVDLIALRDSLDTLIRIQGIKAKDTTSEKCGILRIWQDSDGKVSKPYQIAPRPSSNPIKGEVWVMPLMNERKNES
jgi:DNA polymerase III sliding clamp (beta) subunit (PCNA family)